MMFKQSNRQVNLSYNLLSGDGCSVEGMQGCSMLEFCIFIQDMGLEEAKDYTLVPCNEC